MQYSKMDIMKLMDSDLANIIIIGSGIKVGCTFAGCFRYESDGWEMIYNPWTRTVHHLQPIKPK